MLHYLKTNDFGSRRYWKKWYWPISIHPNGWEYEEIKRLKVTSLNGLYHHDGIGEGELLSYSLTRYAGTNLDMMKCTYLDNNRIKLSIHLFSDGNAFFQGYITTYLLNSESARVYESKEREFVFIYRKMQGALPPLDKVQKRYKDYYNKLRNKINVEDEEIHKLTNKIQAQLEKISKT